jgi:hypothetical protein
MKCHLDLCQNRYETRMDSTSFCIRLHFDHEYMAVYFVNAWIFLIRTEVVMVSFSTSLQESQIRTRRRRAAHLRVAPPRTSQPAAWHPQDGTSQGAGTDGKEAKRSDTG